MGVGGQGAWGSKGRGPNGPVAAEDPGRPAQGTRGPWEFPRGLGGSLLPRGPHGAGWGHQGRGDPAPQPPEGPMGQGGAIGAGGIRSPSPRGPHGAGWRKCEPWAHGFFLRQRCIQRRITYTHLNDAGICPSQPRDTTQRSLRTSNWRTSNFYSRLRGARNSRKCEPNPRNRSPLEPHKLSAR